MEATTSYDYAKPVRRFNPGQLISYAFALGTAASVLALYAAIIVRFLSGSGS